MEPWFIYTLLSVLFSGAYTFSQKVATERGYPSTLSNVFSAFVAALSAIFITTVFYDFSGNLKLGIIVASIPGILYMLVAFFRLNSHKYIDSAILFPLYKTFGPIFVLLIGVLVFGERFNFVEWIGIFLSILVPLMLLNKSEEVRQKNLWRGVLLVLLSAFLAAIAAAVNRAGMNIFANVQAFVVFVYIFSASSAVFMYVLDLKKSSKNAIQSTHKLLNIDVVILSIISGVSQFAGFIFMMLAFKAGGPLAIVYTVNSFYILIPIVLSIIIYKEHWNARKAFAIALSVAALWFLR